MRARKFMPALVAGLAMCAALAALTIRPDLPAVEAIARFSGPDSMFVAVDGMKVHYRNVGSGPTLILLHGSNSSLHTWQGWINELKDDLRLIALDLPGHGLTGPNPTDRYDPEAQAEFLDHFVDTLGLTRFSIAGNSMGGEIAWHYVLAHPSRVDKLILIDSAGFPHPIPLVFRLYGLPLLGRLITHVTPRFLVAKSLRDVYADDSKVTDALVYRYHGLMLREGNRVATRKRLAATRSYEASKRLGDIRAPTLVEWGAEDTWIPVEHGRMFAREIPRARLRVYPNLGHIPMEEDPVITAADALRFLLDSGNPAVSRNLAAASRTAAGH